MSAHRGEARLRRRTNSMSSSSSSTDEYGMPLNIDTKSLRHDERQALNSNVYGRVAHKPLIDYVTNEWQTNPKYEDKHDFRPPGRAEAYPETQMDMFLDFMDDLYDGLIEQLKNPIFYRNLFLIITTIGGSWWIWFSVLAPHMLETRAALATYDGNHPFGGRYGLNRRPIFSDMIQVETLNPDMLPVDGTSQSHSSRSRRLVVVGDIHGCKDELVTLLDKMKFNRKHDHLITTGDMIDKGPYSLGVVDLLREMNASCVRGNHEDRVLLMRSGLQDPLIAPSDLEEQARLVEEDDAEKTLARSLNKEQASYLQSCPVILKVGAMSAYRGEVVVVHAGLVPGVPLENQDPSSVMTMRVIDLETYVPSRDHEPDRNSVPWARLWNKAQKVIPNPQSRHGQSVPPSEQKRLVPHMTVIYGHDSQRGLQLERWTKGLDSGCVSGGKLSALVISNGGEEELVQVKCSNYMKSYGAQSVDNMR